MELLHVSPVGDTIEHVLGTSDACPCGPTLRATVKDGEIVGHTFIHFAQDGRE